MHDINYYKISIKLLIIVCSFHNTTPRGRTMLIYITDSLGLGSGLGLPKRMINWQQNSSNAASLSSELHKQIGE